MGRPRPLVPQLLRQSPEGGRRPAVGRHLGACDQARNAKVRAATPRHEYCRSVSAHRLTSTELGGAGSTHIARAVQTHPSLQTIECGRSARLAPLPCRLQRRSVARACSLAGCELQPQDLAEWAQVLCRNNTLKALGCESNAQSAVRSLTFATATKPGLQRGARRGSSPARRGPVQEPRLEALAVWALRSGHSHRSSPPRRCRLAHCKIGDGGIQALGAALAEHPSLERLRSVACAAPPRPLHGRPRLPHLTYCSLKGNRAGKSALAAFVKGLHRNVSLAKLECVAGRCTRANGHRALADTPRPPSRPGLSSAKPLRSSTRTGRKRVALWRRSTWWWRCLPSNALALPIPSSARTALALRTLALPWDHSVLSLPGCWAGLQTSPACQASVRWSLDLARRSLRL